MRRNASFYGKENRRNRDHTNEMGVAKALEVLALASRGNDKARVMGNENIRTIEEESISQIEEIIARFVGVFQVGSNWRG